MAMSFWHPVVVVTLVGTVVVPLVGTGGVVPAVEAGVVASAGTAPRVEDGVVPTVVVVLAPGVVGRIQAMMPTVT